MLHVIFIVSKCLTLSSFFFKDEMGVASLVHG
jgi:hypothetical protein